MNIEEEIEKSRALIHWLINGLNIHCIPPSDWKFVTREWVIKNYNTELKYV